ncbi:MAG: hypothetical protein FWF81_00985 [Defluviitaleaceae bacterium]|nr:hypothetical protein [Defluviitaleaceae bacterium]
MRATWYNTFVLKKVLGSYGYTSKCISPSGNYETFIHKSKESITIPTSGAFGFAGQQIHDIVISKIGVSADEFDDRYDSLRIDPDSST